jgi:hypothetical protein
MSKPSDYGSSYHCIGLADGNEVLMHADRIMFTPNGDLHAIGRFRGGEDEEQRQETTLAAFAAGQWKFHYAASVLDGSAVAVEHWPGQISR